MEKIIGVEVLGPTPIDVTKFSHPIKINAKKVRSTPKS